MSLILAMAVLGSSPNAEATVKTYKSQCATCHGIDGKGQTTTGRKEGVKDWTDPKVLGPLADAKIIEIVREGVKREDGKKKMPAFNKLTEEQVAAVIAYIRSFAKK